MFVQMAEGNPDLAQYTLAELEEFYEDVNYERTHFYRHRKGQAIHLGELNSMHIYAKSISDEIDFRKSQMTDEMLCEYYHGSQGLQNICRECATDTKTTDLADDSAVQDSVTQTEPTTMNVEKTSLD